MNICFVLDTHYSNYTNRLKKTSLKSFIDLNLSQYGFHFFISTNRPDDFSEYDNKNIHIFNIEDLRKENNISKKYEILPEDPTGIYPSKFPWNLERFILQKAADSGFNYIINLDSDVIIDQSIDGKSLYDYLISRYEENTIKTNQAIYTYKKGSSNEIFNLHEKYINHFNLNYSENFFNTLDGPVVIYMGKTSDDIKRYFKTWDMLTNFGYEKNEGFGYENIVCGNWSLSIPISNFKLKWDNFPFIPHHKFEDRY